MLPISSLIPGLRWVTLLSLLPGALVAADLQIEHVTIVSPERSAPDA